MEKLDITQKLADAEAAITSALRTIKIENAGLVALEEALNNGLSGPFVEAVERIVASRGRLVVTGVGKSGHIAPSLPPPLPRRAPRPFLFTRVKPITAISA